MNPLCPANPKRILFLADRLSARGGADRHLLGILDLLQGRPEVETLLAVGFDDSSLPAHERDSLGPWVRVKGLDRSGMNGRGGKAVLSGLDRLGEEFRPDLIHLQNVMDPAVIGWAAEHGPSLAAIQDHRFFCPGRGKLTGEGRPCRRVMGPGCLDCFRDRGYGQRMLRLTRARLKALQGLDRVLVLSSYMGQELVAAGLDPGKVTVLSPFVHGLESPSRPGRGEYHLLACRLVERKGVRVALEAARKLRGPLKLTVAGDGPLAGEVCSAARAGLVRYEGWADRRRMGQLLHGAASLWLPGLWAEPFGIVGLEAMALGTPAIAVMRGGVGEWLRPGENGLAVAPGDPEALARAADGLAADRDRAMILARQARNDVRERFQAQLLMDRLIKTYGGIY